MHHNLQIFWDMNEIKTKTTEQTLKLTIIHLYLHKFHRGLILITFRTKKTSTKRKNDPINSSQISRE